MEAVLKRKKIRLLLYVTVLSFLLCALFIFSIMTGSMSLAPRQVVGALLGMEPDSTITSVVTAYRVPRILFAAFTGLVLGVTGGVMQTLTRNPLADPYITGLSSGAALGAAVALTSAVIPFYAVPVFAFAGGVALLLMALFLAERAGGGALNFILAGLAMGTIANAILIVLITMGGEGSHGILYWVFGSFSATTWVDLRTSFLIAAPFLLLLFLKARDLNIMIFGEEHARQLGVNAKALWYLLVVSLSVAVSACVSFCGTVGFIGLVAPHMVRLVVGSDNRFILPLSGLTGSLLLMAADDLVRNPVNPIFEMPIGSMTALIGVPFFIYLLIRRGKTHGL